jgi:hypothetical protein
VPAELQNLYIYNPDVTITHLPFSGKYPKNILGKLNIDQDDLYVGGATVVAGNLTSNSTFVGISIV